MLTCSDTVLSSPLVAGPVRFSLLMVSFDGASVMRATLIADLDDFWELAGGELEESLRGRRVMLHRGRHTEVEACAAAAGAFPFLFDCVEAPYKK